MARLFGTTTTQSGGRIPKVSFDLSTSEGLESFARSRGIEPPKESRLLNALNKVSRVVNFGNAIVAGATKGVFDPEKSIIQGIGEGVKRNLSFSDVIREDVGVNPEGRPGKIGVATTGFIADVLFDPITYLTFGIGAGLKVGGRALTKTGTKLAQGAARELVRTNINNALLKGITPDVAAKIGSRKVSGVINELLLRATGKKGLSAQIVDEFVAKGIDRGTVDSIAMLGSKMIDEGGIKFFGRTLVSSKALAGTLPGRAARRLGETEIAQTLKNTLGKTFIADFGRNPKLISIVEGADRAAKNAIEGLIKSNEDLFKNLTDDEMIKFFDDVFGKKLEVVSAEKGIQERWIKEFNERFPTKDPRFVLQSEAGALRRLEGLEDSAAKQVTQLQERMKVIRVGLKYGRTASLEDAIKALREVIKDLSPTVVRKVTQELPSEARVSGAVASALNVKVDELKEIVLNLEVRIAKLGKVDTAEEALRVITKTVPRPKKLEKLAILENKVIKIQNEITEKSRILQGILDARKAAKKVQKGQVLNFDNPKLQNLADIMFNSENAIVKRFAKLANIPDDEAIKFYIPSKFRDKLAVRDFAVGRNLGSPTMGFRKKFTGVVNDQLIRDPFEAFTRGQIYVVVARIKTKTTQAVIKRFGVPIRELTEKEAKQLGLVRWTREGIEGKIEAWLPEDIAKELNKLWVKELNPIDEIARVTGLDYVTGLFKGYVTSIFPGFHIRNITSNQFQNMLKIGVDTLNPHLQKHAYDIIYGRDLEGVLTTKMGKVITKGEIRNLIFKNSNVFREGAFGRFEQFLDTAPLEIRRAGGRLQKLNLLSRENIFLATGRKVGAFAEAQAKTVTIVSELMQGKGIKEAVKTAEDALFNYTKLTEFERSVMRRLIPFYTWSRKNFELQLSALTHNPGRVAAQLKFIRGVGEAFGAPINEEDLKGLPDWILESLQIKAGMNKFGQNIVLSGFGLPIEEFLNRFSGRGNIISNVIADTLSKANPNLKFPVEAALDFDTFRRKPITEIDNGAALFPFLKVIPSPVRKEIESLIGWQEVLNQLVFVNGVISGRKTEYRANPMFLAFLRNMFTSRILSTVGFLESEDQSNLGKFLRLFTGIRETSVDQERQKFFNELQKKDELKKFLFRMGVLREKEILFEPKIR